jgi:hypothetical protein
MREVVEVEQWLVAEIRRRQRDGAPALRMQQQDVARHAVLGHQLAAMVHQNRDDEFVLDFRLR